MGFAVLILSALDSPKNPKWRSQFKVAAKGITSENKEEILFKEIRFFRIAERYQSSDHMAQ